jgi:hypothetical protein
MNIFDFLLFEDMDIEEDEVILNEADGDDDLAEIEKVDAETGADSGDTKENGENDNDETKQNNNDDGTETEDPIDDNSGEGDDTSDLSGDGEGDSNMDDGTMDGQEEEEEDTITNSKRLFYYNSFEDLYNTTISFLDKLDSIKDSLEDIKKKDIIIELEKKLIKQKNDINLLLRKKIMTINEENLEKLLMYFSTKLNTTIDITKSVIKEVK